MSLLALRFARWIAAISVLITLAGICLAVYLEYREDMEGIQEQVASVETYVPTLSTSLWRLDDDQIEIQLQGIVRLPAVRAAAIRAEGEILHAQPDESAIDSEQLDASYPLTYLFDDVLYRLGTLLVVADPSYATARVPMRFAEITAIHGVRGLIVAAAFFWIFSHLVGRRLRALADDIDSLNWDNLESRPIPSEAGGDELSEIRDTLESMRGKIVEGAAREQAARNQLDFQRLFDPVTGLPNRTLLTDRLATLMQTEAHAPLVVVAIELLRLSELNYMLDARSLHQALREVADRLKRCAGSSGLVSRYSERRFVVVVGPIADQREAEDLVEELARAFTEPLLADDGPGVFFPAAYGVARAESGVDATRLLARAVMALDTATTDGDGSRAYWGEQLQHAGASIYQELRTALQQSAFDLHCQPIMHLESSSVASLECLVRWHSTKLAAYGTERSIRLAETAGLSGLLDRAVLTAALALRGRLHADYRGPLAINLTARSLADLEFADYLAGQDAALLEGLELELTETSVLRDVATAQVLAEECEARGVRLVLDDFGTGFSSIQYLGQFRFHAIKIDRSFLRQGMNNQQRLLQSMVSIAHGVGSTVVGEGIEFAWQLDLARELAMDFGQGFLLSRPLAETDVRDFLEQQPVRA